LTLALPDVPGFVMFASQAASVKGHQDVARLLLKEEADINAWGGEYINATSGYQILAPY
jgi:hypothetical protein